MWYHRPVSIERINPGELGRPSGFSHAVSTTGGRLVFLAGQTGYAPDGAIAVSYTHLTLPTTPYV